MTKHTTMWTSAEPNYFIGRFCVASHFSP